MTISTVNADLSDDEAASPTPQAYKYDLRLEIGVKEPGSKVPVASIFYGLVRRLKDAADDGAPVVVMTATDKLFHETKEMPSEEFQKAFHVDNLEGKVTKVLLGFKIQSLTKLSELKRRLLHTYLIPNNLFIRPHIGGFQNGVKSYSYGFLQNDHPDHPDISMLKKRFARIVFESWKKLGKDDRAKWRKELPNLFFGSTGIVLPINFTKERISTSTENKERITTSALVVTTPTRYGKLMKALLDIAMADKKLNNLVPFALSRENSEGYYYLVAQQARFIENHRNIPIMNIPVDADIQPGNNGDTLSSVLNSHSAINRVAYDPEHHRYHVSTSAAKYKEVHQWLTKTFEELAFPYGPQVRPMKYGNTSANGAAFSYSDIFKDAMTRASDTYSVSTIKTTQSSAWRNRPPTAISYDLNEEAFPSLTAIKKTVPATPSTTSELFDEDTIQSAISVAIKKLEVQHREELNKLKLEMQGKIDEVTIQMKELGQQVAVQTIQALVTEESPLVTKTDHANLQHEMSLISTQLSTIISMFQQHQPTGVTPQSPTRTSKRSKPTTSPAKMLSYEQPGTQSYPLSSATSDLEEEMEGCDE